ncbi:hypothetical protein FACS189425_01640 [Clostridia bacterium]|nr:hypothetical protein FACS189425_01640 [Clostridia bacterium]
MLANFTAVAQNAIISFLNWFLTYAITISAIIVVIICIVIYRMDKKR